MFRADAFLASIVSLALPPRCPGCGAITDADHRFCATCWGSLRFLAPPWCAACNVPFAFDRGEGAICAVCQLTPPCHAGIRAAVDYGDVARTVALRLKYGRRISFATTIARQLVRLVPDHAQLLVPVPLHRTRLWSRGFNQAALIASEVGKITALPADPFVLRRVKRTPSLRGKGAAARAAAMVGAFAVGPDRPHLRDRSVILVDDVHTSGATADGCTRTLLRAGASRVTILCWARVLDHARTD